MDRPRLIRGLQIAASAVFGIVCVLLVVVWVRSRSHCDIVSLGTFAGSGYVLESVDGSVSAFYLPLGMGYVPKGWDAFSQSPDERVASRWKLGDYGGFGFASFSPGLYIVVAPHWLLAICAATLATAPWIRSTMRFSLRSLLIATTIIAVVLGLVVWSSR